VNLSPHGTAMYPRRRAACAYIAPALCSGGERGAAETYIYLYQANPTGAVSEPRGHLQQGVQVRGNHMLRDIKKVSHPNSKLPQSHTQQRRCRTPRKVHAARTAESVCHSFITGREPETPCCRSLLLHATNNISLCVSLYMYLSLCLSRSVSLALSLSLALSRSLSLARSLLLALSRSVSLALYWLLSLLVPPLPRSRRHFLSVLRLCLFPALPSPLGVHMQIKRGPPGAHPSSRTRESRRSRP